MLAVCEAAAFTVRPTVDAVKPLIRTLPALLIRIRSVTPLAPFVLVPKDK